MIAGRRRRTGILGAKIRKIDRGATLSPFSLSRFDAIDGALAVPPADETRSSFVSLVVVVVYFHLDSSSLSREQVNRESVVIYRCPSESSIEGQALAFKCTTALMSLCP